MPRHVLVVNRWNNEFSHYDRYIDHAQVRVSYLASQAGAAALTAAAAAGAEVAVLDLEDHTEALRRARGLADRHGPVTDVVALSEFDMDLGAVLREELSVPGPGWTGSTIALVRDKVVMKRKVAEAGLRVPGFAPIDSADEVRAFAADYGFPFVLKPRSGADSRGVTVVSSSPALDRLLEERASRDEDLAGHECEEFVNGDLYQIDGVVAQGRLRLIRSWKCLAGCLDFIEGSAFGAVVQDDPGLEAELTAFTERVLTALQVSDGVFHLEAFREPGSGDAGPEPVFLELGARPGGGQLRHIWREVFGTDLIETAIRAQLGDPLDLPTADRTPGTGGYLMMPIPAELPFRVDEVTSLIGVLPEVYAEELPSPGQVLDGIGGAVHTGGVYRFRAATAEAVEAAIAEAVARYRLRGTVLAESQPTSAGIPA